MPCERTLIHAHQRYELHHRICNLRYGTPYYRINSYYKLEFSQFFISVFFLFQLINRPIVEITKINADVREKIPSVTTNMINVANGI